MTEERADQAGRRSDLELAHELNIGLLRIISTRQERKFLLSLVSLLVMLGSVVGLLLMAVGGNEMSEPVENLLIILLTAAATGQSKLFDFWFNNSNDDNDLVEKATSYAMDANHRSPE